MATVYRRGDLYYTSFRVNGRRIRRCLEADNRRLALSRMRQIITRLERVVAVVVVMLTRVLIAAAALQLVGAAYPIRSWNCLNSPSLCCHL